MVLSCTRYEDAYTNPGHPFACGITLDRINGYTIDELGREAFVTNNPLQMLRKALTLRRIAVYFDTDSEFWAPGAAWRDLAPHDWDEWFLPGVSAGRQERGGTARSRQYVLQPVDGQARYTRRGAGVQAKEDEPVLELDFQLNDVAVCLTRPQYQSYHLLLAEVSSFSARLPYAGYRPRLRPAAGEPARLWWRYAVKAVQQQLAARKLTWSQTVRFARMRKEYVPAYAEHLRQLAAGQGPQRIERLPAPVVEMDRQLPEQTILMFRRLAHAKVQREKRRAAKEAAAAGKSGGGGWMDWLRGGGSGQGSRAASPRTSQAGAEEAPELTPEEYGRLVELVEQQEQGMRLGPETPYTLLTRIGARVSSASALLLAADGSRVLRGGLEDIHLTLDRFPETLRLQLGVGGMGLECPEGTLIRTGGQLHRLVSETDLTAEMAGPAGAAAAAAQRALAVQFVQKPQDGSADALLDVVLTPSYVIYSAAAVDRVVQFFRTPQELDFSSLSAQATTQLERARRLAAQYAAAALQSRPKLKLHLELDAPKVAIPAADAKGRTTLALDFGRFIIESDPDTPAKLPAEEAALYECVRLEVSDVAAYVADGAFDWQDQPGLAEGDAKGGQPGQLIPLLNRTGMSIALQARRWRRNLLVAARFADPKYPVLRLQPSIPVLHFYLSPGRMGRLLRVVRAALPPSEEQQAGGTGGGTPTSAALQTTAGAAGQELWRQHAEYEGAVKVLTWGGIGYASASWCPRYGVLYQGKLYLYESSAPGAKLAASEAVWAAERRVVRVPPEQIGGAEHVVALCPGKWLFSGTFCTFPRCLDAP
ncbi:hypothetical protein COHA_001284 [Chlorella ohadii]|uniref:Chorein N-terminal domain-containing protein n=1 Tax=Chlorella ohadii TaxID=2649997 RepID=A0AAD5H635_9CHLO|nr:hypothetical protein COHA_001284 [Chlorella ohadii]